MTKTGCTVAELIEWLRTQDQGAIVQVVQHTSDGGYHSQGGTAQVVEFDPGEHDLFSYSDFRTNPWVGPDDSCFEKRYLLLGVHEG
jgi:hypothetical protein